MEFKLSTTLKKVLLASAASLLVLSTGLSATSTLANAKHRHYHYHTHRVYRHHRRTRAKRIRRHARHIKYRAHRGRASWEHGKLYYTTYAKRTNRYIRKHAKHTRATHKTYARCTHRIRKARHYAAISHAPKAHRAHHNRHAAVLPDGDVYMDTDAEQSKQQLNCSNELVNDINRDREDNGLNDLTVIQPLNNIADNRSVQVANNFTHRDPNGQLYIVDQGAKNYGSHVGENIASSGSSENVNNHTIDENGIQTADNFEDKMMNNDADSNWSHRRNILDPSYRYLGIGCYYNNDANQVQYPGYTISEVFAN